MHINNILSTSDCCGCTSCASICPKQAITMAVDQEGFKRPSVNEDLCISCGLCVKSCPIIARDSGTVLLNKVIKAYAMKHNNEDVLARSSSGGLFTALSDLFLNAGGIVYGAAFDENMVVRHIRATDSANRDRMRGSKYVQSDIEGVYSMVSKDLQNGSRVLFSGTPCQIEGLKLFLKGKTENLFCVDFICHGVPSPKILSEHFKKLERTVKSRLTRYQFRPKRWGWHMHREIAYFENGREYCSSTYTYTYTDLWTSIYYGRLATRTSCHNCRFTNLNRPGDITMGDCRGVDRVLPDFGSYAGASLLLVNTPKGQDLFSRLKDSITAIELDINEVMQPPMVNSCKPSPLRDVFWKTYLSSGYDKALYRVFGRFYPIKNQIKKWLRKR